MNETIKLLQSHGSVRNFSPYTLTKDELLAIIDSAKQAPSWMNFQSYNLFVLQGTDKEAFADVLLTNPNNKNNARFIKEASAFVLFTTDFSKVNSLLEQELDFTDESEPLLISSMDAALAVQNTVVAAESLGFSTVVVGAIRNVADKVIQHLNLPNYAMPLAGVAIGKGTVEKNIKPRMPHNLNVFHGKYDNAQFTKDDIINYGKQTAKFGKSIGYDAIPWDQKITKFYQDKNYTSTTNDILKQQKLK